MQKWKRACLSNKGFTMADHQAYLDAGKIIVAGNALDLTSIIVEQKISEGANGTVFLGRDPVLGRKVAIKIWQKLRDRDRRNKLEQGVLEAKKAIEARGTNVVEIFSAGVIGSSIYAVMEYVDGFTLRKWLGDQPPFGLRLGFAWALISSLERIEAGGVFHGDLHDNNVMIFEVAKRNGHFGFGTLVRSYMPPGLLEEGRSVKAISDTNAERFLDFKIIDFGTSKFSGKAASRERHYQVLEETLDKCLAPLKVEQLYGDLRVCPEHFA